MTNSKCNICKEWVKCHGYQEPGNTSDYYDMHLCDGCWDSPFKEKYEEVLRERGRQEEILYEEFDKQLEDVKGNWADSRMSFLFNKYEEGA